MGDRVAVMSHGRPAAGRHAAAALRPARQPVRRRLHRHAADEPARGDGRVARTAAVTVDARRPARAARRRGAAPYPGLRGPTGARSSLGVRAERPASRAARGPTCRRSTRALELDRGARLASRSPTSAIDAHGDPAPSGDERGDDGEGDRRGRHRGAAEPRRVRSRRDGAAASSSTRTVPVAVDVAKHAPLRRRDG